MRAVCATSRKNARNIVPGASLMSVLCSCEEKMVSQYAYILVACDALFRSHASVTRKTHSVACEAHGNAHAAADAERGKALLGIAFLHFVQQGHEHARARCADRMTDRDRAAIDVDL